MHRLQALFVRPANDNRSKRAPSALRVRRQLLVAAAAMFGLLLLIGVVLWFQLP